VTEGRPAGALVIRGLEPAELDLATGLDVGEAGDTLYRQVGRQLSTFARAWARPSDTGDEMRHYVERWRWIVDRGGAAFGAFRSGRLAGLAVVRLELEPGVAQLDGLYVDRRDRGAGIATRLDERAEATARASGARELYVSATPTPSAVGFYRSRGYEATDRPNADLLALEPDDIHMRKALPTTA
jgi:GNAT superfamily N-acetyltransferase